jgi:NADH-quinone oxidoreductase subunit L
MMRVWWLTFMGKPRDEHVYEHAHESKLMYVPLVVLAAGTLFCSYFVFRPLLAEAAPRATDATFVVGIDGHAQDAEHAAGLMMPHAVHGALVPLVGFAFVVGFVIAWLIYRDGLEFPKKIAAAPGISIIYRALVNKLYFDHVYNFVLVGGCKGFAWLCRLFDTYVIDLACNLSAWIVERASALSGWVFDARGVDGACNGLAWLSVRVGDNVRRPQTGRIRNYVLIAAGVAAIVVLVITLGGLASSAAETLIEP